MENNKYSKELIEAIKKADARFPGKTFYAFNGYFTLRGDHIAFLYDEQGDWTQKSNHSIGTYSGLSEEEDKYLETFPETSPPQTGLRSLG